MSRKKSLKLLETFCITISILNFIVSVEDVHFFFHEFLPHKLLSIAMHHFTLQCSPYALI